MSCIDGTKRRKTEENADNRTNREEADASEHKKGTSVTVDTDLLDCIICFLPLCPPLFQCQNGHVACPSCCDKHRNKWPTCTLPIKYSRCLALEKLIESIEVPCSNDGCIEKISYADLQKHEEDTCIHAPRFCPIPDCTFSGSFGLLSYHVDNRHKDAVKHLKSNPCGTLPIVIRRDDPFCMIRADGYKELFLLANYRDVRKGNALYVTCICPQSSEYSFVYDLRVYDYEKGSSLRMEAPMMMCPKKWTGSSYHMDFFLMIPWKFNEVGSITVHIDINKIHVPSAAK